MAGDPLKRQPLRGLVTVVAVLLIAQGAAVATEQPWREPGFVVAQAAPSSPTGKVHRFAGFSLYAPEEWKASVSGGTLTLAAPDQKRTAMVWWWFPDEPLLGYPDIVSHRKIMVAGQAALWIHSRSDGRDRISVTLDKARSDKKRWHLLFEVEPGARLDRGDPILDRLLTTLTLDGLASKPKADPPQARIATSERALPSAKVAGVQDASRLAEPVELGRIWLDRVSFEVPSGWVAHHDEGLNGIVMTRPDGGAEMVVSYWPEQLRMPGSEIESMANTMVLGEPATRLDLRMGMIHALHLFFDEPRRDGSRLNILYRTNGEPLADGLPIFELLVASLGRGLTPPKGAAIYPALSATTAADPFKGMDMSELEATRAP